MQFGERLRTWRQARGLSQRALATKVGLTAAAISYFESGDSTPKLDSFAKLVDALGTTMNGFYGAIPKGKRQTKKRAAA